MISYDLRLAERFFAKVDKRGRDECWLWRAALSNGYGAFWLHGHQEPAHRVAYKMLIGPIPEGLTIDHLCRNRPCVNPAHMEPVTNGENVLRGIGITAINVTKTHCPQGHPYDEANTIVSRTGKRSCRACHRAFTRRWRKTHLDHTREYQRARRRERYAA